MRDQRHAFDQELYEPYSIDKPVLPSLTPITDDDDDLVSLRPIQILEPTETIHSSNICEQPPHHTATPNQASSPQPSQLNDSYQLDDPTL